MVDCRNLQIGARARVFVCVYLCVCVCVCVCVCQLVHAARDTGPRSHPRRTMVYR